MFRTAQSASVAGAVARRVMGTTVIGGLLAATLIAIFLIPVTFYVMERFAGKRRESGKHRAPEAYLDESEAPTV